LKIKTFLQFAKKFIADFSLFVAYCSISPLAFGAQSGKMCLQHFKSFKQSRRFWIMERVEIFRQLIETDKNARSLFDDAVKHKESLDEDLKNLTEQLRTEEYETANDYLKKVEAEAVRQSDEKIEDLNRMLDANLEAVRLRFEQSRDAWSDQIFRAVIHQEAGSEA